MKGESFKSWCFRTGMNWYPMFFGTGGKITFLSRDFKKATVRLKLNMWTYNYVGSIFGGSQFAALDPFHMVLLINVIGKDYIVWDKGGAIRFKKPGKGTIVATVEYTDDEIADIKSKAREKGYFDMVKSVDWIDAKGEIVSTMEKTIYISTKESFKNRKRSTSGV